MTSTTSATGASIWLLDSRGIDAAQLGQYEAWLGPAETARYARFARPLRRRQFLLGRALLRAAMGKLLDMPPPAIVLEERPGQAPLLLSPEGGAHFSISHSGHWVACALSRTAPLGLDIEVCDPRRDVLALARQAFGAEMVAELEGMPLEARLAAFYRRWSEAEARYKLGMDAASCVTLPHAELSIVLCSAAPLAHAPVLMVPD
ncbi:4-phosphopantetheinyl transferase [Janthinobacterium sp. SUN118]|uniref:4'-phosphopantetheinyl transferase family protein n=1 Tax=Janthinobacterium sp. SUN118 TaxID=3004100 RepID=UPI0025B17239|nr:4-phosphopantetheinyl transferase [Janthinobacterium sp. SUN118]MDN2708974.1 4-phosphopantetheinyl transferase [Janthinobacterium sp. SUN118]